jgi:hypothetical protein
MTFDELETALGSMLKAFRVNFKTEHLIRSISVQHLVSEFGLVVVGFVAGEYQIVEASTDQAYPNYRKIYISHLDNLIEKKDEVLWALMRGGYMKWLRNQYAREFYNIISMNELGKKIINKRLEIWGGLAKHQYLINYNQLALRQTTSYILSMDPSFYDFMPE